jgi:hypothetical protein
MLHELPNIVQQNIIKRRQEKIDKELESPIKNYPKRKHKKY